MLKIFSKEVSSSQPAKMPLWEQEYHRNLEANLADALEEVKRIVDDSSFEKILLESSQSGALERQVCVCSLDNYQLDHFKFRANDQVAALADTLKSMLLKDEKIKNILNREGRRLQVTSKVYYKYKDPIYHDDVKYPVLTISTEFIPLEKKSKCCIL